MAHDPACTVKEAHSDEDCDVQRYIWLVIETDSNDNFNPAWWNVDSAHASVISANAAAGLAASRYSGEINSTVEVYVERVPLTR